MKFITSLFEKNDEQDFAKIEPQSSYQFIKDLQARKDFASKNSGATILKKSNGIENANSILSKSNEEYLILPDCNTHNQELIINLSEEVGVEYIVASNHEDFSANLKEIQFYGSSDYPPKKWKSIGGISPVQGENYHLSVLNQNYKQDKSMIRYLKAILIPKEDNDLYCTLTHV